MARANFVDSFLDQLADAFIQRVMDRVNLKGGARNGAGRSSALRGRKLEMRCRYPGCRQRSRGPRNHFLCTKHLKDPGWPAAKAALAKAASKAA